MFTQRCIPVFVEALFIIGAKKKTHPKQTWKQMSVSRSMGKQIVMYLYSNVCDPMDGSLRGSSVHGIFQAVVLEWIAISFSRGSSDPGIEPRSPAF